MHFRSSFALLPFLLAAATGCAPAPLQVSIDNQSMNFNQGVGSTATTSDGAWRLTVTGNADPVANAVDDEFSLSVRVDLDDAMLDSAARGVPLAVNGVTTFATISDQPSGPNSLTPHTFVAGSGHSPLIRSLATAASCFCTRAGNETQTYSGTITLQDGEPNAVRVIFDLTLDGQIPFRTASGTTSHAVIHGVAIAPRRP